MLLMGYTTLIQYKEEENAYEFKVEGNSDCEHTSSMCILDLAYILCC